MTEAQRAHVRLLESLPRERFHTHIRSYADRSQGQRLGNIPEALVQEVKALQVEGLSMTRIMRHLTMGEKLYKKIDQILIDRGNK